MKYRMRGCGYNQSEVGHCLIQTVRMRENPGVMKWAEPESFKISLSQVPPIPS